MGRGRVVREGPNESFEVWEAQDRAFSCPGPLVSSLVSSPTGCRSASSDSLEGAFFGLISTGRWNVALLCL